MNTYIIDVGTSHNAPRGIELRNQTGLPVIFIEPDTYALNQVPAIDGDIKLNCAIAPYDGEIEFNFYQQGTHSVLKTNVEEISKKYIDGYSWKIARKEDWIPKMTVNVPCKKLSTIIKELNIDEIPYLKIDTQGYDLEVIKSLEEYTNIVKYIECEVQTTDFEVYINQSKKEDIIEYLSSRGFELIITESQTFNQEENLIFERIQII